MCKEMYWTLLKLVVLTFAPILPVSPRLKRPDPIKNLWTFECDGFTSFFEVGKIFYTDTLAAQKLTKKSV